MAAKKAPKKENSRVARGGIPARMAKILELREEARKLFAEADDIESGLLDVVIIGKAYKLPNGAIAAMSDNFAAGKNPNVVWKASMFRHYEVKPLK